MPKVCKLKVTMIKLYQPTYQFKSTNISNVRNSQENKAYTLSFQAKKPIVKQYSLEEAQESVALINQEFSLSGDKKRVQFQSFHKRAELAFKDLYYPDLNRETSYKAGRIKENTKEALLCNALNDLQFAFSVYKHDDDFLYTVDNNIKINFDPNAYVQPIKRLLEETEGNNPKIVQKTLQMLKYAYPLLSNPNKQDMDVMIDKIDSDMPKYEAMKEDLEESYLITQLKNELEEVKAVQKDSINPFSDQRASLKLQLANQRIKSPLTIKQFLDVSVDYTLENLKNRPVGPLVDDNEYSNQDFQGLIQDMDSLNKFVSYMTKLHNPDVNTVDKTLTTVQTVLENLEDEKYYPKLQENLIKLCAHSYSVDSESLKHKTIKLLDTLTEKLPYGRRLIGLSTLEYMNKFGEKPPNADFLDIYLAKLANYEAETVIPQSTAQLSKKLDAVIDCADKILHNDSPHFDEIEKTIQETRELSARAAERKLALPIDKEKVACLFGKIKTITGNTVDKELRNATFYLIYLANELCQLSPTEEQREYKTFFANLAAQCKDKSHKKELYTIVYTLDPEVNVLKTLVDKMNKSDDVSSPEHLKDVTCLLNQEIKILAEDLTAPDEYKYYRALFMDVPESIFGDLKGKELEQALKILAIQGVNSTFNTLVNIGKAAVDNDFIETYSKALLEIIENTPEMDSVSTQLKGLALNSIKRINTNALPESINTKLRNICLDIQKNSENKYFKSTARSYLLSTTPKDSPEYQDLIEININGVKDSSKAAVKRREDFIALCTLSPEVAKSFIPQIMASDKEPFELKEAAVWAAGKFQSKQHFNLLEDVLKPQSPVIKANSLSDEELKLREMALYSIANYREHKNNLDELSEKILNTVSKSHSALSELAQSLHHKNIDLKHSNQDEWLKTMLKPLFNAEKYSDTDLNKKMLSEMDRYKSLRDQYVPNYADYEKEKQYFIDKTLLPFRKVLEQVVKEGSKLNELDYVQTDHVTSLRGKRSAGGFFSDTSGGSTTMKGLMTFPKSYVDNKDTFKTVFGHEWGHVILFYLQNKLNPYLTPSSFKGKAKEEYDLSQMVETFYKDIKPNYLDHYAAITEHEYFAQVNEAYLSVYKPHEFVIEHDNYQLHSTNTRNDLKRKDPDMYDFIQRLYDRFNEEFLYPGLNKGLALVS